LKKYLSIWRINSILLYSIQVQLTILPALLLLLKASTVMLVSVVQFYTGEDDTYNKAAAYNETKYTQDEFFETINGPVYFYKLWSCIAVATAGVLMFFAVLLMHFDTICFPRIWFQVFRDGSLAERNILISMVIFWSVSLHINTSSLSVGTAQANVYFTTWIVFVCTVLNLGVWRQSADLPQVAVKVLTHQRETTYNWCWTLLFVLITAGAATDMYFHRDDLEFQQEGEELTPDNGRIQKSVCFAMCLHFDENSHLFVAERLLQRTGL
jgi:hypothetical protein